MHNLCTRWWSGGVLDTVQMFQDAHPLRVADDVANLAGDRSNKDAGTGRAARVAQLPLGFSGLSHQEARTKPTSAPENPPQPPHPSPPPHSGARQFVGAAAVAHILDTPPNSSRTQTPLPPTPQTAHLSQGRQAVSGAASPWLISP